MSFEETSVGLLLGSFIIFQEKLVFNFNWYFQRPQCISFFCTFLGCGESFVFTSSVSSTKKPVVLWDQTWLPDSFPRTSSKMEPEKLKKKIIVKDLRIHNLVKTISLSFKSAHFLLHHISQSYHTIKLQIPDEVTRLSLIKSHKTNWSSVIEMLIITWLSARDGNASNSVT